MPIYAYRSGAWTPDPATNKVGVDDVRVFRADVNGWKRAHAAYVYAADGTGRYDWRKMFDLQPPRAALQGTTLTYVAAKVQWTVGTGATGFRVKRVKGSWDATHKTFTPSTATADTSWMPSAPTPGQVPFPAGQREYEWPSLQADTVYGFTVVAYNQFGFETDSNTVVVDTGHPEWVEKNPAWPSTNEYLLTAKTSNSWNARGGWGAPYGGPRTVTQGNTIKGNDRISHGCVDYSTLRSQIAAKVNAAKYPTTAEKNAAGAKVATAAAAAGNVTNVLIRQVHRTADGGANGPVTVDIYLGKCDFGRDRAPERSTSTLTFKSPDPNSYKVASGGTGFRPTLPNGDSGLERMINWVRHWLLLGTSSAYDNNVMIAWTNDGTGNDTIGYNKFCNFDAVESDTNNWRLVVDLKWNVVTITNKNPVWLKQQ